MFLIGGPPVEPGAGMADNVVQALLIYKVETSSRGKIQPDLTHLSRCCNPQSAVSVGVIRKDKTSFPCFYPLAVGRQQFLDSGSLDLPPRHCSSGGFMHTTN